MNIFEEFNSKGEAKCIAGHKVDILSNLNQIKIKTKRGKITFVSIFVLFCEDNYSSFVSAKKLKYLS